MPLKVAKRKRAPRIDPDVIAAIQMLALDGMGAEKVQAMLEDIPRFQGRVPASVKTIRKYALQVAPPDPSGRWSPIGRSDASMAVLRALAEIIERTEGRIRSVSVAEAERITRLDRLAPDLIPLDLWGLARVYGTREADEAPTDDLDAYLAFGPWRGVEERLRYQAAVDAGWIRPIPTMVRMLLGGRMDAEPDWVGMIGEYDRFHRRLEEFAPTGQPERPGSSPDCSD